MDRMNYWVSVGNHEIVPQGEGNNHEFEIAANEQELDLLRELFDEMDQIDNSLVLKRASTPYEVFTPAGQEVKTLPYDKKLIDVYRTIYDLGLPNTKEHIRGMNIL
ncbi:hypothetical protein EHS13_03195 [Paenibacillus psychroresistens]|uniref:Uncharacterized protein n=1 Tax=Paenibacillus psychroresistens TaxID=1778678 RepID=A0A6B8RES9_9BACL|nr:hypothetical protein [Paenibacillus psychroresistens]QGQ93982.1 hypothetical protein EHS13_03195 [Paenibacillus psychroresistens]